MHSLYILYILYSFAFFFIKQYSFSISSVYQKSFPSQTSPICKNIKQNQQMANVYNHIKLQQIMRALMKGKAADFFVKKDKVVQDPEDILNQIQAKNIAKYIGIDEQQIKQFQGFFQQVIKIKLPKGFKRFPNNQKTKIHYLNQLTGEQDTTHPSIDIIKMAFYQMLADGNSVFTFSIKSSKLLPFVEQKMIKQCIGLSSKRRDAQKANLQRDENGKVVISKLARLKPDLRPLISSRSYMLKSLVEKIYTKKQVWGKGKKANVYAALLAAQRGNQAKNAHHELQQQQLQTQEQLELYQKIFVEGKNFYQKLYGSLNYIPRQLQQTKSYFRSTPQSVLRNLGILNIEKDRMQLYWLARLMECLPLPPGWSIKVGDSFDKFFYEPKKLFFDLHPSYIYILERMNQFKIAYMQMDILHQNYYNNMKQMTFFDYFERPYTVDLFAYVEKINQLPRTKKKAQKKSEQLGRNDWMALEGIKNSDLKPQSYVLIQDILAYWKNLNCREDNYSPAISPFGQVVWSSNINQRTINFCPHANILRTLIQQKQLQIPSIKNQNLKQFDENRQKQFKQLVFDILPQQRQNFLKHYIRYDPKPLSAPYQIPKLFNQNQFYDTAFISEFDLEMDLKFESGTETPIWVQKVHAKKNTDLFFALINKDIKNFEEIKNKFSQYALQMIKKHEPTRYEDIIKVISQIKNAKELKKFIHHINDIDSREQRKRLAAIGIVQEQDSFGSSISQIQMDEEAQSQPSSDDLIEIEGEKSQESIQKQESVSSSDHPISIKSYSHKRISQVSQQSETSQRVPEKYEGIIYEKNEKYQKLNSEQLNQQIIDLKKQKLLKHKYSKSSIKGIVQKMSDEILNQKDHTKEVLNRKKNLLLTRFNSEHTPFKVSPDKIRHRQNIVSTPINLPDISQQFEPFRSQSSILGNEQISPQIRQQQRKKQLKRLEQQQNQRKKTVDDTKQTIQLQPIKRIKPDINQDRRLRHISQFMEIKQFGKTFNQESKIIKLKLIKDKKQKNNLEDTASSSKLNPQNATGISKIPTKLDITNSKFPKWDLTKQKLIQRFDQSDERGVFFNESSQLKKSSSVLSLSNNSISPTKFNSKFNRVCLGNTASSLLSTQALMRQTDLVILQARKSLVAKSRGLQTLVSKKY